MQGSLFLFLSFLKPKAMNNSELESGMRLMKLRWVSTFKKDNKRRILCSRKDRGNV